MAVEPSLSEITSIQGDAAIGAGANGLNLATTTQDSSLPYLQAASIAMSAADKAKNDEYNKRLEASLTNLNEQDFSGLLDNDFKDLSKTWAGLMKTYSDNFDIIRNPNKNRDKWAEIQQQTSSLRANLAAAKDQKKVYDVSQKFLAENPTWNTDLNRSKLDSFLKSPRDSRQVFQFDRPFTADINLAAKAIGDASAVEVADSQLVNGGKYIRTTEGKTIDTDVAAQNALNFIRGTDAFGRKNAEEYQKLFDALPEKEHSKYTDVEDFFVKNTLAGLNRSSVTKNVLQANPFALQNDDQAFKADQNEKDRALARRGQDLQKATKVNTEEVGAYKNELVTRFWETGSAPMDVMQNVFGNNQTVKVVDETQDPEDPNKTQKVEVQKPALEFLRSSIDSEGNRVVVLKDNTRNGRTIRKVISLSEANTAFNNVLGSDKASQVADGSRKWLDNKIGKQNYDFDAVKSHFEVEENPNGARSTGTFSNQRKINFKGKNIDAGVRNGKWYNIATGQELK